MVDNMVVSYNATTQHAISSVIRLEFDIKIHFRTTNKDIFINKT